MSDLERRTIRHYICNSSGDNEIDTYIIDAISYLNDIRNDVMEIWPIEKMNIRFAHYHN